MTENMKHWDALKVTDPKYTKAVTFGRRFTSINSQWQLQRMTEQFGPIGQGWGYEVQHSIERLGEWYALAVADVTIWWKPGLDMARCEYGPVRGTSPVIEPARDKGRLLMEADGTTVKMHLDDDAGKKAMTDALTKGLSHLGLSADVFLGLFDDNKYVRQVAEEYANGNGRAPAPEPEHSLPEADRALLRSDDGKSQYQTDKRKQAEQFCTAAMATLDALQGPSDVSEWYATPVSPKGRSTNRNAVERLKENFPDLGEKLEAAADEVRLRNGARAA